jgi:predicted ArsR family transcriptional regulator
LGRTRERVLDALVSSARPVGVDELAADMRMHVNTVRFHLEALAESGLASRASEQDGTPGRPRVLYQAREEAAGAGTRSYRLLAEVLTSHITRHSRQPAAAALQAGHDWGRRIARPPSPARRVDARYATEQLVDTFVAEGFEPTLTGTARNRTITLHHCPFLDLAAEQPDVVCAVHLGLARGVLDQLDAPLEAESLTPFATPNQCLITLRPRRRG